MRFVDESNKFNDFSFSIFDRITTNDIITIISNEIGVKPFDKKIEVWNNEANEKLTIAWNLAANDINTPYTVRVIPTGRINNFFV